ncbi:hypothetical protein F4810DRAFT_311401 [Camillea tinctor]|nr:hypothetical protein F4810DRAFT_311401 [Camillea tinctor]
MPLHQAPVEVPLPELGVASGPAGARVLPPALAGHETQFPGSSATAHDRSIQVAVDADAGGREAHVHGHVALGVGELAGFHAGDGVAAGALVVFFFSAPGWVSGRWKRRGFDEEEEGEEEEEVVYRIQICVNLQFLACAFANLTFLSTRSGSSYSSMSTRSLIHMTWRVAVLADKRYDVSLFSLAIYRSDVSMLSSKHPPWKCFIFIPLDRPPSPHPSSWYIRLVLSSHCRTEGGRPRGWAWMGSMQLVRHPGQTI